MIFHSDKANLRQIVDSYFFQFFVIFVPQVKQGTKYLFLIEGLASDHRVWYFAI